ncbi:MAG: aminodeoxychorismate/anthranilate synthase component II, partial [Pseudomonadota bacterium]
SPGPCTPADAGISVDLVHAAAEAGIPLLGVCLGHQAIGAAFGAEVTRGPVPVHGKTSPVAHDGSGLFDGLPQPMTVTRYHSLIVTPESLPNSLRVTATSDDGQVMGLAHADLPIFGVQFHPESVASPDGLALLANFLRHASRTTTTV